jgi:arylsulfatase A-like enzyme
VLAANGYVTVQVSANPFTGAVSGLDRGFDTVFTSTAFGEGNAFALEASPVFDRFLEWAASRPHDRYFAYLHVVDTHGATSLAAYRAAARRLDGEIARLLKSIGETAAGANVLVAITADHGEAFADHGRTGHGQSVYEEEIRVPLIIREPTLRSARVVDEPVHLVDLMPTLLDYTGIAIDDTLIQGRSLRRPPFRASPVVVTKFTYPEDVAIPGDRTDSHAIVDFPWKLITREEPGQPRNLELYRLDVDPAERDDLADDEPARTKQLEAALDVFLHEQARARARFLSTYDRGRMPRPVPARELVDQLRSLGYVR